ncbi:helix-turn-helix domain-containing protein [Microcystis aeruginosa]|uniref:HTH cro/C1-type domain-containing protein n=2 Tax=Microcystis aeruginosa (strain PCC 7806) TaxID=267872 RepID=A0AB33C5Y5_MICA7|nr:helix-turn-helix domain-containing protein [Microcystis aeruginosa]TRU03546.1 MAG: helix-turn-helix domain-containing protein [Microcystis aeruginosa Ma_AC_P_19900807_S300]ARI84584.1 hypothetical protein BH695_5305 [Microcystis aeruginosa PCC 7806SL]ELS45758.1 hypothetical protein C789_4436 [Microcystis aeruginosa FACHB-905 = DIANCHI905]UGS08948.1 helix-turn-helix domain-containing protein [Microcystis aeruginosa FACHB-905 = DIANCHI905]WKX62684.1 helix-turn-helix domain-containing protein [
MHKTNRRTQYINRRKQTDSQFSQGFEFGYLSFKLGVILAQAREEAGLTQEELAPKLNWDKATVFNLEENVESVGISTFWEGRLIAKLI